MLSSYLSPVITISMHNSYDVLLYMYYLNKEHRTDNERYMRDTRNEKKDTSKHVALNPQQLPDWLRSCFHERKHPKFFCLGFPKRVKVSLVLDNYLDYADQCLKIKTKEHLSTYYIFQIHSKHEGVLKEKESSVGCPHNVS